MNKKTSATKNLAFMLYENLNNVFRTEEEIVYCNVKDDTVIDDYYTALLIALKIHFGMLMNNEDMDMIDFIGVLNRIAIQYLIAEDDQQMAESNT